MSTKLDPGKYDCYSRAEPDEPMFILLARDPLAPILVELWASIKREQAGALTEKHQEAYNCAYAMRTWKRERKST